MAQQQIWTEEIISISKLKYQMRFICEILKTAAGKWLITYKETSGRSTAYFLSTNFGDQKPSDDEQSCLLSGILPEKCVVRQYWLFANITKCTYTNLDGTIYYTRGLYDIPPPNMPSLIDQNIIMWHRNVFKVWKKEKTISQEFCIWQNHPSKVKVKIKLS